MKICLLLIFGFTSAWAQIGASSSPILLDGDPTVAPEEAIARGRYQIRKESSEESAAEGPSRGPASEVPVANKANTAAKAKEFVEPSLSEQAQSLVDFKKSEAIHLYKEQIHPDDIRNNRLEIQGTPSVVYNDSSSNFSYRAYSSFFPAMDLSANVWMAPSLGLYGRIMFSFGASLTGDSATDSNTPAKYEDLDLGLKYRKFFGFSRMANSVEFALMYSDSSLFTENANPYRAKLNSSGLGLRLNSRIPSSAQHAWTFGAAFFPRLQHTEEALSIGLSSGSPAENSKISFNVGSEVKFSREGQIVYDLSLSTERNVFDGKANPVDPETMQTPSNVTVTNTFVQFGFGYRWGR